MTDAVDEVTERIKDIVRGSPGILAMDVLRTLDEKGHNPQEAAFAIAYAVKHGDLELDGERRLHLAPDDESVPA